MERTKKILINSIILAILLTSAFALYQIFLKSSYVDSQNYNLPQDSIEHLKSVEREIRIGKTEANLPIYLGISFILSFIIMSFLIKGEKKK